MSNLVLGRSILLVNDTNELIHWRRDTAVQQAGQCDAV
jgi:hypothetical protein